MDFQTRREEIRRFQAAKRTGRLKELIAEERRKHKAELCEDARQALSEVKA